jgi:hypothetical protein
MSCKIDAVVIDCLHPERVGRFWAEVLGWGDDPENPNLPGDPEWLLMSPDGTSRLLFQPVPEPKSIKNRLHFDVQPEDRSRDEECTRLLELGAVLVADHREPDGSGWITMADVENNEFCIVRSHAERA